MKNLVILFVLSLMSAYFATADQNLRSSEPVVIPDSRCVNFTAAQIHHSITNYALYKDIDDGILFDLHIPGTTPFQALDMFISDARFTPTNSRDTDALVLVTMQPVHSTNKSVYPTFLLHCTSKWLNEKRFTHQCAMTDLNGKYPPYALKDFRSNLDVTEGDSSCSQGARMNYSMTLVSNSDHVQAIKNEVVNQQQIAHPHFRRGVLEIAVDFLFNEKTFFNDYYKQFYERWVQSIK